VAIARRKRRTRLLFDPRHFPRLSNENHRCTSDPVEEQNCIAYAMGDKIHFWWPVHDFPGELPSPYFWPLACPLQPTLEAFISAFKLLGFETCKSDEGGHLEEGMEKIALFAVWVTRPDGQKQQEPTHAAVQSPRRNGKWRSKMGEDEDIEHDHVNDVGGGIYGEVVFVMRRPLKAQKTAAALLRKRLASH
jgi:hypothetical protein